jgi:hypothetical protein
VMQRLENKPHFEKNKNKNKTNWWKGNDMLHRAC